jgi:hypothetical protein
MKFNIKMIAAAAMVSAGAANAAPIAGNNGSLSIVAFNTVTQAWYIRDTGYLINSFLPSSVTTLSGDGAVTGDKTPNAGLNLNKTNTASFADASFSTWLTGQTQSDVRWFVSAVDDTGNNASNRKRFIASGNDLTASNGQLDNYVSSGNAGGIGTFYEYGTNGALSSTGTGAPYAFSTQFGLVNGSSWLASLGDSVGLFYFARSTGTGSTVSAATKTQFGNATGYAAVSLAANGDFTYDLTTPAQLPPTYSQLPIPAAAWLMASGLAAMGVAAKRRKAITQG